MALYRITINKDLPDKPLEKPWSNVYYADVADLTAAIDTGILIRGAESAVSREYVRFTTIHAVQAEELHQVGRTFISNSAGVKSGDIALMLPLFNTVRVILADTFKRPSQKYLRLPLEEGDITSGELISGLIDDINGDYIGALLAISELRSNTGDSFSEGLTAPVVQNRQRGWHRRVRPGYKRGWVPE